MYDWLKISTLVFVIVLLSACGGGGGSDDDDPIWGKGSWDEFKWQ